MKDTATRSLPPPIGNSNGAVSASMMYGLHRPHSGDSVSWIIRLSSSPTVRAACDRGQPVSFGW